MGSQTISRWIKSILRKSGVDVTKFSSHSTRHASTSAALVKGVDLSTIKRTTGWMDQSLTFARFYNRPISTNNKDFASAVLDS